MTLLDLIPVWAALTASALTAVCLWGAIRLRVLYSPWDPSSAALFQVTFTFWVLILIRLLPVGGKMLILNRFGAQGARSLPK